MYSDWLWLIGTRSWEVRIMAFSCCYTEARQTEITSETFPFSSSPGEFLLLKGCILYSLTSEGECFIERDGTEVGSLPWFSRRLFSWLTALTKNTREILKQQNNSSSRCTAWHVGSYLLCSVLWDSKKACLHLWGWRGCLRAPVPLPSRLCGWAPPGCCWDAGCSGSPVLHPVHAHVLSTIYNRKEFPLVRFLTAITEVIKTGMDFPLPDINLRIT